MNYRWTLRPIDNEGAVAEIAQQLNALPDALARALVLRGVDSFDRFCIIRHESRRGGENARTVIARLDQRNHVGRQRRRADCQAGGGKTKF